MDSILKYPGDKYYYVICDLCGVKVRAKDTTLITDKLSLYFNALVCTNHKDEINPQLNIKIPSPEKGIRDPKYIRPEGQDIFSVIRSLSDIETGESDLPDGREPEEPLNIRILTATAGSTELMWEAPLDSGSGLPTGWKIERESPVGGGWGVLVSDTGSPVLYYKDTTTQTGNTYNYRISTITRFGTSDPSLAKSVSL